MKKTIVKNRKYFVKEEEGVCIASEEYFNAIESRTEAFVIAFDTYNELLRQMFEDSVLGDPSFIGSMKITTGLERSLVALDQRYPGLLLEMRSIPRRAFGRRMAYC